MNLKSPKFRIIYVIYQILLQINFNNKILQNNMILLKRIKTSLNKKNQTLREKIFTNL